MKNLLQYSLVGALSFLVGCATSLRDFNNGTTLVKDEDEAIVFGHFDIEYNGKVENQKCAVCFKGAENGCYKLPKSGNVLMRAEAGETRVHRVSCLDVVEYHYYPENLEFKTLPRQKNYIGSVYVKWDNPNSGFKWDKFFDLMGAVTNEKKPDGTATLEVKDDMNGTLAQIEPFFEKEDDLPINVCMVGHAE